MLKIWGRNNSVNVQKVLWCCEEMAVEYERIDAGGAFGIVNTPEYRRLNPNGLVPTIDDDGFVLWESHAIVRYLAAKHAAGFWPEERRMRAEADQWMDWSQTTFWPAIRPLFMGLIRTAPEQRDARAIEDSRNKTAEALVIVDAHLGSRAHIWPVAPSPPATSHWAAGSGAGWRCRSSVLLCPTWSGGSRRWNSGLPTEES